ncbi:peroxisomal targeting signal 2 receptor [Phakopsora pachyrhizi]|uniref:Peroxin-7 n=1 Tax=Phakopsora pachyrhizi TaxID=170000 RepID=A0AAV0B178_PHAPC|nr:peroxisomal targeting signal 2 receptor [Phakopsora pachyrhizi]CAH7675235.1 peroxisomal targeting signal 2 receptor [Phakopsora pachyrhizi]
MMNSKVIGSCQTPGFAGYSCEFSPFYKDKIAISTAANFGLVGNGRLHLLNVEKIFKNSDPNFKIEKTFDTQDGLYDLAWSEIHENQLVTGSGDGSIKLWDITLNEFPIQSWNEHKREVFCLDWNNLRKDLFVSSSWDNLVKIWNPMRSESILTIPAHESCVYSAKFSPSSPNTIATCSSDGTLKIWDTNLPSKTQPVLTILAHPAEVLSLDWNKYSSNQIATGSVDRTVKIHDLRMAVSSRSNVNSNESVVQDSSSSCVCNLIGHQYAIRKVAWSPHCQNEVASSGYDMTARVWLVPGALNQNSSNDLIQNRIDLIAQNGRPKTLHVAHREFVVGLAWSFFHPGIIATASWDQQVHLWSS